MRKFNPDKELKKIQQGNKNKIILFVISLLVVGVIGYSFALYQVRYSKRIIYTKVAPFNNKDINILAVYVDGVPNTDFPEKNSGYRYDHIECDNGSTAKFDSGKWELILKAKKKDKCNVYFVTVEEGTPNVPELYQGLIPVTIESDGTIKVADTLKEWYNYDNKQWANAVLVNNTSYSKYVENDEFSSGTTISMNDILQMYVWIPRYKYQLFNAENEAKPEQEIQIQFESGVANTGNVECKYTNNYDGTITEKCTKKGEEIDAKNDDWYTHPAFTFKGIFEEEGTELPGIWIGKFESSGVVSAVTIKPNITSLRNINLTTMFNASRNIEEQYANNFNLDKTEIDTHMMKNIDWGAMTYLTHSKYGRCTNGACEQVTKNSNTSYLTGYASQSWNTTNGQSASTTGNMYGIYDTSGGSWEYVMGNMVDTLGQFYASSSDSAFYVDEQNPSNPKPDSKYYDAYEYGTSQQDYQRGHLGDATREILKVLNIGGSWYGNFSYLPFSTSSWLLRGGYCGDINNNAGLFAFSPMPGALRETYTFRVVLTAQDGDE